MQSLMFYSRLVTRAIAGSVGSDSCKDSIATLPRGNHGSFNSSPLLHGPYAGTGSSRPIFSFSFPRRRAVLSAQQSPSYSSPVRCHNRLFQRLLADLLPLPPTSLPIRAQHSCTAAVAASSATHSQQQQQDESHSTQQQQRQQRLALKLITAQCGFSKDNFPSSVAATRAGGEGGGHQGRGWMASMRRRLRMEQGRGEGGGGGEGYDSSTEDAAEERGMPTAPTAGRAACFGDDSFFVTADSAADVLGVADGVGGWRNYGVDPSLFSSSLMATCQRVVNEGRSRPDAPKTIIATGYHDLIRLTSRPFASGRSGASSSSGLMGSSTICIVSFHRDSQNLYAANLGDSGFAVYRNGKVIHRSTEQQHYFNTPYQLSLPPQPRSGSNSSMLQDSPEVADASSVPLEEGDVIVLATDGLWDNLDDEMIWEEIEANLQNPNDEESLRRTARALATRARSLAFDPSYMSPFAKNARKAGIQRVQGGKPDDITILLSTVAPQR